VLNVGGFDRRKNLPALVEGFAMALPAVEQETDLVIVGSPHSGNVNFFPPLEPVINRHGLGDRVKLTGFVSEQDKLDLYRAATAFVFTSTYEGFGLNPLEAMACGTPVISSNRSSLPEVVGDGGILIDPTPGEIAAALAVLLNDANLQEALRQRGLEQAHTFSWSETARQTVQAYRGVLDNER
jgi:glycosyltransferase involved in cell wall biosynthesis